MFKKKLAKQAVAAAVAATTAAAASPASPATPPSLSSSTADASTSTTAATSSSSSTSASATTTAAAEGVAAPRQRRPGSRSPGSRARTLALIEKHRKILEEAERQREEMATITEEQTQLQEKKTEMKRAAAAAATTSGTSINTTPAAAATAGQSSPSSSPPPAVSQTKPDAFTALIDQFLAATEPLADLDETMQLESTSTASAPSLASAAAAAAAAAPQEKRAWHPPVLTYRTFSASLVCPKKFYLLQNRTDLIPKASLGDMVHFDDSVGFNELARRWDRLQFGSRAHVVKESDFAEAVQHTERLIVSYFQGPFRTLGEQAPTLTIHRPAFAVPMSSTHGSSPTAMPTADGAAAASSSSNPVSAELRARPAVLRYRPKENQWVFIDTQAVIDPVSTSARITHTIQRFHFTILCFRLWLTQPHLPIEIRKKFLQVNLDDITGESLKGHTLESSARPAAAVDLKRSGLLHIRQFFPGPATLVDCAPPQLVKFIQRLSLEELMEEDAKHYGREGSSSRGAPHSYSYGFTNGGGGAFDLKNCHASVAQKATVRQRQQLVETTAREVAKAATQSRTGRGQKHREETLHRLLEYEQALMEDMLRQHTLPLMEQQQRVVTTTAEEGKNLTSLSNLLGDEGFVRASSSGGAETTAAAADAKSRGKKNVKAAAQKVKAGTKGKHKTTSAAADNDSTAAGTAADDDEEVEEGGSSSAGPLTAGGETGVPCYGQHIGPQCLRGGDACPFFVEGMCLPRKVADPIVAKDNHLFTLPSTSLARKSAWWAEGKRTIRDVLTAYERGEPRMRMTQAQLRYAEALTSGQVALNPREIDDFFAKIRYPLFIIDFEAVQFALPPFQKQVAYQSIPFQFSLDVFQHDILTEAPTHYNYLHFGKGCSPNTDPRPGCVAELIRIVRLEREKKRAEMESSGELARLAAAKEAAEAAAAAEAEEAGGGRGRRTRKPKPPKITKANPLEEPLRPYDGSFLAHFASFEKSCLEKLGQLEEQYRAEIKEFFFLDTIDLIKKGCIHPNAHGSNSLKKVLPALCPDFQYGVFGSESSPADDGNEGGSANNSGGAGEGQDEQKGENAMGVYRLWYHLEGGGTVQDLQRATRGVNSGSEMSDMSGASPSVWTESVRTTMTQEERDRMWDTLRIQLVEYCSLDTKALYEILRELHAERTAVANVKPKDKTGWVLHKPMPREMVL